MKNLLKRGFTLIELLIVIAIVGILTALITTNLSGARSRARDTRRKSDLRTIAQSLRLYYNDAKQFPEGIAPDYAIIGCGTIAIPLVCSWGGTFATDSSTYSNSLPTDPSSSSTAVINYQYYSPSDDAFLLVTSLENASDPDITATQLSCTTLYTSFAGEKTTTDYRICVQ